MTNEEKLKFIQYNYVNSRKSELIPPHEKDSFLQAWAEEILTIVPTRLYKYRTCNENNLNMLRNRTAWFSCPSTWNDPIDVTVSYDLERDSKILQEQMDEIATKMAFTFINRYIESFCEQKKFVTAEEVKAYYYGAFQGEEQINPERIVAYLTPVVGEKQPLLITRVLDESLEYAVRPETLQDLINQETESLYISLNTKTPQWIGEEEWRFGVPKIQVESNAVPFDFAESIYLGENIEDEWKDKLLEIAREQGLAVYQRKLDSTKSRWVYEELSIYE